MGLTFSKNIYHFHPLGGCLESPSTSSFETKKSTKSTKGTKRVLKVIKVVKFESIVANYLQAIADMDLTFSKNIYHLHPSLKIV